MCGGKEKAVRDGRDALCVPRPVHTLSLPFSPPSPNPSASGCRDSDEPGCESPAVTQVPEPILAPALLSSPAPVALTSAMPITAICLLWGALGHLVWRAPRPFQGSPPG